MDLDQSMPKIAYSVDSLTILATNWLGFLGRLLLERLMSIYLLSGNRILGRQNESLPGIAINPLNMIFSKSGRLRENR